MKDKSDNDGQMESFSYEEEEDNDYNKDYNDNKQKKLNEEEKKQEEISPGFTQNQKKEKNGKQINEPSKKNEESSSNLFHGMNSAEINESNYENFNLLKKLSEEIKVKDDKDKNYNNNNDNNNKKKELSKSEKHIEKININDIIPGESYETKYSYIVNDNKIEITRLNDLETYSYLNAVLRCIGSIKPLKNYFLEEKNGEQFKESVKKNNTHRLSYALHRLFTHIWSDKKNEIYKPKSILRILGEKNKFFTFNSEMNPNNCIIDILNQLHGELSTNTIKDFDKVNEVNVNEVIIKGRENYKQNNNSIITDNFNFNELETIRCKNCGSRRYQFQSFLTFDLDIYGAYKLNSGKSEINIYDCLDLWKEKEIEKVYCNKCEEFKKVDWRKNIINSPKIFVFLLDRGNFDNNLLKINFAIEDTIDLQPYVGYQESSEMKFQYKLKQIVSIFGNKYISFVKMGKKHWFVFDNDKIQMVEHDNVIKTHRNDNIKHIPCILFYELVESKNNEQQN